MGMFIVHDRARPSYKKALQWKLLLRAEYNSKSILSVFRSQSSSTILTHASSEANFPRDAHAISGKLRREDEESPCNLSTSDEDDDSFHNTKGTPNNKMSPAVNPTSAVASAPVVQDSVKIQPEALKETPGQDTSASSPSTSPSHVRTRVSSSMFDILGITIEV